MRVFADMRLLVDTGADATSIHWADRKRLRDANGKPLPEHTTFAGQSDASGIAGAPVQYGTEDAEFYFRTENNGLLLELIHAKIALDDTTARVPSLLGRDILSVARLDFDMPADRLALEWPT
ncbi:hypothetical protein [Candidatus Poriferisodalis sp.]|uniref:hypothetical protein n=1 Tax=Candidatus Poriferisodalis sp. TaxID=3101277 RepID=UPI003B02B1ED